MTFINNHVVKILRREVKLFTTSTVDIRRVPKGDQYEPWAEAIYKARGQIGLLAEEATLQSGIDWDPACEGIVTTKNDTLSFDNLFIS